MIFRIYHIFSVVYIVSFSLSAATYYVSSDGTNNFPYTNWGDAATNIQWAVDVATNTGDTVLVSNGTYNLANTIMTTNRIIIRGLNGRDHTFINGNYPVFSQRCFLITNATLDGFTISNGWNQAKNGWGGGIHVTSGYIYNCAIRDNSSSYGGGIALYYGQMSNCVIIENIATNNYAGGAFIDENSIVRTCWFVSNTATAGGGESYGGGAHIGGFVSNCVFYGNTAEKTGIGGGARVQGGAVHNSLFYSNTGSSAGAIWLRVGSTYTSCLFNCTIASNTGTSCGGVRFTYTDNTGYIDNCIIYNNAGQTGISNLYAANYDFLSISNSCVGVNVDLESSISSGNIRSDPIFVSGYRLEKNSPCVNSGVNREWMAGACDLDGYRRIDKFNGLVDMGCFEYLFRGTMFSFP